MVVAALFAHPQRQKHGVTPEVTQEIYHKRIDSSFVLLRMISRNCEIRCLYYPERFVSICYFTKKGSKPFTKVSK